MASTTHTLGGGAANRGTAAPGSSKQVQGRWRVAAATYDTRSWGDIATGLTAIPRREPEVVQVTPLERDFQLWLDMVENPCQYGDDIIEWLDLNGELMATRKAWKIESYWRKVAALEADRIAVDQAKWRNVFAPIATQAAVAGARRWVERDIRACVRKFRGSAVKIQAAVRGHQVRTQLPIRDCCMCLAHRISPFKTDVGYMCRECADQGPYVDITGPLSDPWSDFRGDFNYERRLNQMIFNQENYRASIQRTLDYILKA